MKLDRFEDFRTWARDRNLIDGSDPVSQLLKTAEELGELAKGVNKNRLNEIKDGIGDVAVTLVIVAEQWNIGRFELLCNDRFIGNFVHQTNKKMAVLTLLGEIGYIAFLTSRGNTRDIDRVETEAGALTRCIVMLQDIANLHGVTFEECLDVAWAEIKDRKGHMQDGVFIKEGD